MINFASSIKVHAKSSTNFRKGGIFFKFNCSCVHYMNLIEFSTFLKNYPACGRPAADKKFQQSQLGEY